MLSWRGRDLTNNRGPLHDALVLAFRFDAYLGSIRCKVQRACGASIRIDDIGRWSSARVDGLMLRRTLSCDVVRVTGATPCSLVDSTTGHESVRALAEEFAVQLEAADLTISDAPKGQGRETLIKRLSLASQWTAEKYGDESKRFAEAYPEAVEILPPDRYGDLVLLPALGCPNSRCSFCAFYKDRRFRMMNDGEFANHLDAVCDFMGESVSARHGIFLGSASALSLSQRLLVSRLVRIGERLGTRKRGVGAFWDPDHCPERTSDEWAVLQEHGLRTAYLGLETGLASLRANLGKSADMERLLTRVRNARDSGLSLGVMVLAGIGGTHEIDAHIEESAAVIDAMELSPKDLVFVSPLVGARDRRPLNEEAVRLHAALAQRTGAKVAPYAADKFHYYS
ncbi:MAG: hypothetical protein GY811_26920 [Myxococcales bacterium]|nr:hypothetical protein [Myxococcales bacterium]